MPTISNKQLMDTIYSATEARRIDWQATGVTNRYGASFGGKYTIVIDDNPQNNWLEVKDAEGERIVRITDEQDPRLADLYEMARRQALKIDESLSELIDEINKTPEPPSDDDIPL
jgi:hypothetical protein